MPDINECDPSLSVCVAMSDGGRCTELPPGLGVYCACAAGYSGNGIRIGQQSVSNGNTNGTGCTGKLCPVGASCFLCNPVVIFTS